MKYTVFTRYQSFSNKPEETGDHKKWSNWFKKGFAEYYDSPNDPNLLEEFKLAKESSKDTDKRTKLKHEYKIGEVDESEIIEYDIMYI